MLIELNGSEGGGQILRTALTLSKCTGHSLHLRHIRAGRKNPGLMRQHQTAVQAAAAVCSAKVDGATVGSTSCGFRQTGSKAVIIASESVPRAAAR